MTVRRWTRSNGIKSAGGALLVALFLLALCGFSAACQSTLPYQNPALTPEQRAADLVSRMTLEEKVSQTMNSSAAIPRLGVPAYDWWSEGLHGIARSGYATVFPQAIGNAATWDDALLGQIATLSLLRRAPSITRPSATTFTAFISGSRSGRRISTFFAIPAGGAARRLTAKIHFLRAILALPSSRVCRVMIRII